MTTTVEVTISPRQMAALEAAILKRGNLRGIDDADIRAALKEAGIDAVYDGIVELRIVVDRSATCSPRDGMRHEGR